MEPIPFIDIRESDHSAIACAHTERGKKLIAASARAFGIVSRALSHVLLPVGDWHARGWLERNDNPYRHEIAASTSALGVKGVHALNLCYEWGCTSGAYNEGENVTLARVLDWPFPALGECMVVAHQRGTAGDFYNITWPGMAGVFNAMAPGRFAAALNQAPMRRHRMDIVTDWARNRFQMYKQHALPPAHLLRKVFEEAASYEEAKHLLATQPIALPVIFILSGTKAGEGCVIERLEDSYAIREMGGKDSACAANHFETHLNGVGHGWLPRALESHGRAKHGQCLDSSAFGEDFHWFKPPIANRLSRLAFTADAGKGTLHLIGTDGERRVTEVFTIK
ncbi:MAG: hypothetical protein FJX23_00180 [Alphaproteobacteria bacterium]|nr:hypothetical protein [Alphaproteobacteria bacterium]